MDLKEAFKTAIRGEIEGRELYKVAAEKTTDAKAKKVFAHLAEEEDSHFKTLQKLAESYFKDGELVIPELKKLETFEDAESPIFSANFKDFVKDKHFEVSTLAIGIKLELEARTFYKEMADSTDNVKLKEFFLYLSDWENDHYNALRKQIGIIDQYYNTKNSLFRF